MARGISAPVGKRKKNNPDDVKLVQGLLNPFATTVGYGKLKLDGDFGPKTSAAIGTFQRKICKINPDYVISPRKKTITLLLAGPAKVKSDAKAVQKAKDSAKKMAVQEAVKAAGKAAKSQKLEEGSWTSLFDKIEAYADELYDDFLGLFEKNSEPTPEDTKKIAEKVIKEAQKKADVEAKAEANQETDKVDPKARKVFVSAKVIERANTKRIINKIMPAFKGVDAKVISGYLDDEAQFWKVNYHWEYLVWMIDHSLTLDIDPAFVQSLNAIRRNLMRNQPNPKRGYRKGGVGNPVDKTPIPKITQRWRIVRQAKKDFKQVTVKAGLKNKSNRVSKAFHLAAAPIARPGTSKHGTGYALDIKGDNNKIKQISRKLGASLVFDEKSHVHIEFANL